MSEENVPPSVDAVERLRQAAAEAVINANVNPSQFTPAQHEEITCLQTLAARAATEANLSMPSLSKK